MDSIRKVIAGKFINHHELRDPVEKYYLKQSLLKFLYPYSSGQKGFTDTIFAYCTLSSNNESSFSKLVIDKEVIK